jgi:hypothetical protein
MPVNGSISRSKAIINIGPEHQLPTVSEQQMLI